MQLTQHTDYGLRLLIAMARHPDAPLALPGFAAEQGLSYHHVAKVAQALVHEGFAISVRGRNGGLCLAQPPAALRVGHVVRALEKGLRLVDCANCRMNGDCALSGALARALEAFLAVLDEVTLEQAARPGVSAFAPWLVSSDSRPQSALPLGGDGVPCRAGQGT